MDLLDALARANRSADDRAGRDYGFHDGTITDVDDPKSLGRVRARIAAQGADTPSDDSDWLIPAWPGSIEAKPRAGEPVIVGFIDGNPNRGFYLWYPRTTTENRATEPMVLGYVFTRLYNDLVAKFNALQANYQALYTFVQGHVHASFGTVSASLVEATIGPTAHNTNTDAAKGLAADRSTPAALASASIVLSGDTKVR